MVSMLIRLLILYVKQVHGAQLTNVDVDVDVDLGSCSEKLLPDPGSCSEKNK